MDRTRRCMGPSNRRVFLQTGATALGGLGLADILRLKSQAAESGTVQSDTAVLFVWLPGGPSHIDTYDMKPQASSEIRGDFRPIKTNVSGLEICELFPKHAKLADQYNIVRSISHEFADHGGGHKRFMTGRKPKEPTGFVNDAPAVPTIVAQARENVIKGVPNTILATDAGRDHVDVFSMGAAYLGPKYHPFSIPGDPSRENFAVPNISLGNELANRLEDRKLLLGQLDRFRSQLDKSADMAALDTFQQQAIQLLTSSKARQAFDLSQESAEIRELYGRHAWGQRALLGMRLIEAGSSFVTVVLENPTLPGDSLPQDGTYNWDSHAVNCHIFNDSKYRFPIYDQVVAALVTDLYRRGLNKKVMLIVTGEFGRTPRIEYSVGTQTKVKQPGRDHWPSAMSLLVSGGGMRTGQIIGSTNSKGEVPQDRPLTPNDLWATAYRHLGIDYNQSILDHSGRPMPILPFGNVIEELRA
jgi:hypothetical protein